jgi:hypothetical protein
MKDGLVDWLANNREHFKNLLCKKIKAIGKPESIKEKRGSAGSVVLKSIVVGLRYRDGCY